MPSCKNKENKTTNSTAQHENATVHENKMRKKFLSNALLTSTLCAQKGKLFFIINKDKND